MRQDKIRLLIYLSYAALLISLFYNMGMQPLRMEEPRRALVALEMDIQENWVVPTLYGEPYYNKPPFWNWCLVAASRIFGGYTEVAIRFFAVLAFFLMGLLSFQAGKRYVSPLFGHVSALLFLVNFEMYFIATQLGEIDLFYGLITFMQLLSIFHFAQRGNYFLLFLVSYILAGVGFLTKGLPSVAFQGITLLTFFAYRRLLGKLVSFAHILGIAAFLLLVSGYFLNYSQYNSPEGFVAKLWTESQDRTVFAKGLGEFFQDLLLFPLETLGLLLPASFLLPFVFRKEFFTKLQQQPFIQYCAYIFFANALLYWLSPGTRPRYIYMLLPLWVNVMVYFAMEHGHELPRLQNIMNWVMGVVMGLIALACLALPFIPELAFLPHIWYMGSIGFVLGAALVFAFIRFNSLRWLTLVCMVILARFVYASVVFPVRSQKEGDTQKEKDYAIYLSKLVGNEPVYLMEGVDFPYRMGFYLTREKQALLQHRPDSLENTYFIAYPAAVRDLPHEEIAEVFDKNNTTYVLIKRLPSEP